jgi:hypothetical protein
MKKMRRLRLVAVIVCLVPGAAALLAARPTVRAVRITPEAGATVVVVEADGVLPSPNVGVLSSPPRIFLDLPGVGTATRGTRAGNDARVSGVRVAVNQPRPLVTRVVIDLVEPMAHSIDIGQCAQGRISIVISNPAAQARAGEPTTPSVEPPPAAAAPPPASGGTPPAQPPATGAGATPPAAGAATAPPADQPATGGARDFTDFGVRSRGAITRAPEKDVARYLKNASAALDRLEALRPVLLSLDARAAVPDDQLRSAALEFEAVARMLATVEPPRTLEATHEQLQRVCNLGALAARARIDSTNPDDATRAWNAASASAGAMMLLEWARAEMGMSRTANAPSF